MGLLKKHEEIIARLFQELEAAFPHLRMEIKPELNQKYIDFSIDIPRQTGLKFDVHVNLQGDELHLCVGTFSSEWFPCTNKDIVDAFRMVIFGVLSGELRILEHYRGKYAIKAELQRPVGQVWETVGKWSRVSLPIPWQVTTKELRNI